MTISSVAMLFYRRIHVELLLFYNIPLTLQCPTVQTVHLLRIGGKRQQLWMQLLNNINVIFSDSLNKECPVPVHHQVDEAEGVPGEADEVGGGQVHKQEPHPALPERILQEVKSCLKPRHCKPKLAGHKKKEISQDDENIPRISL